jgi:hypothetical protein
MHHVFSYKLILLLAFSASAHLCCASDTQETTPLLKSETHSNKSFALALHKSFLENFDVESLAVKNNLNTGINNLAKSAANTIHHSTQLFATDPAKLPAYLKSVEMQTKSVFQESINYNPPSQKTHARSCCDIITLCTLFSARKK